MGNPLYTLLFGAPAGESPFLLFPDAPPLTRADVTARAAAMAAVLVQCGLAPGTRLVAQVEKSADLVALYAACLRQGVVFVPLNTALPLEETLACLTDTRAAMAVVPPDRLARLRQVTAHTALRVESLSHDRTGSFADLTRSAEDAAAPPPPVVPRAPEDAALILYTGGGGAARRGVILGHGALAENARALVDLWRITPADVVCHALPLHQAHGLSVAFHAAAAGGAALMFLPRYEPATLADAVAHCTVVMGVPSFYARILAQNATGGGRFAKVRLLLSGTAPLPADTHAAFARLTGLDIADRFALTETGVVTAQGAAGPHPHGETGPALPGVALRITGEEGDPLPPDTTGMIELRSPALFSGYVTPQGEEAPPLRPGGWFVTGELGRLSPDGTLSLAGKAQEQILSGGFAIDPVEVEAALMALADVADCAVIGLPSALWGEAVVAVVVPRPGRDPDPEELLADLGFALARFKRPRRLVFAAELPRNALGRLRKEELRARFMGLAAEL